MRSGVYIVTITSDVPVSVNASDPRIADACIKVTRANCKVGKAKDFSARQRGYEKTFGPDVVTFKPIAELEDVSAAERVILKCLSQWRIRGATGRKNEWLQGISPKDVERLAISALVAAGVQFRRP